jgi:hypothetical protein
MATSLPVFLKQDDGTALVGSGSCGPRQAPANAGRPSCRDTVPPKSTLRLPAGYRRRGARLAFRGRSSDRGCRTAAGLAAAGGRVARVYVSLASVGRHDCRFIDRHGRLTKRRSCRKPILLRAKGTTRWTFGIRVHVRPGNYRAVVRAIDTFGNKERPSNRRDIIRFRLPRH